MTEANYDELDELFEKLMAELHVEKSEHTDRWYDKNDNKVLTIANDDKVIWVSFYHFWSNFETSFNYNIKKMTAYLNHAFKTLLGLDNYNIFLMRIH